MRTGIYAIYDTKADTIVGGLHLHKHHPPAVRMFTDIAGSKDTMINRHPNDFSLIQLGTLVDDDTGLTIQPHFEVIITGAQWGAINQQPDVPDIGDQRAASKRPA